MSDFDANLLQEVTQYYYSQFAKPCFGNRIYEESSRTRSDGDFQRDYTRIMYSSSFRRLQGKMQLLGIKPDQFFRNRLTHSLEVAQIARSIASELKYNSYDTYVVEAAALAHDLGNPPFGHFGERVLNKICIDIGGFEGNAQTLRILTHIEKKRPEFQGLNLTYRTLLSVIKYFKTFDKDDIFEKNVREENLKNDKLTPMDFKMQKFIYDDDYNVLQKFLSDNDVKVRTLDVQILDLADEIAYAAHDLEDGLRQKFFTIDEIVHDFKSIYYEHDDVIKKLEEIIETCKKNCHYGQKKLDSSEYSQMLRKEISSHIINSLIRDIGLVTINDASKEKTGTCYDKELGFKSLNILSKGLKKLIFSCINHNDEVYFYEQKGAKIINGLFILYSDKVNYLPPEYRAENLIKRYDLKDITDCGKFQKRLIADYISGMMDSYAIATYKKFFGESELNKLN